MAPALILTTVIWQVVWARILLYLSHIADIGNWPNSLPNVEDLFLKIPLISSRATQYKKQILSLKYNLFKFGWFIVAYISVININAWNRRTFEMKLYNEIK